MPRQVSERAVADEHGGAPAGEAGAQSLASVEYRATTWPVALRRSP
jgi:hypothetical protein